MIWIPARRKLLTGAAALATYAALPKLPALAAIGTPTTIGSASTSSPGTTTQSITTTATVTSGNWIFVGMFTQPAFGVNPTSVTDSAGNTYTIVTDSTTGLQIAYSNLSSTLNSSGTITATYANPFGVSSLGVMYAAQVSGISSYDSGAENGNSSAGQPTVTSNALATSSELVVGMLSAANSSATLTYSEGSGFSNLYNGHNTLSSTTYYSALSYKIVSSNAAVTWSPTYNSSPSGGANSMLAAFEGGGAPASPVCTRGLMGVGPC